MLEMYTLKPFMVYFLSNSDKYSQTEQLEQAIG